MDGDVFLIKGTTFHIITISDLVNMLKNIANYMQIKKNMAKLAVCKLIYSKLKIFTVHILLFIIVILLYNYYYYINLL